MLGMASAIRTLSQRLPVPPRFRILALGGLLVLILFGASGAPKKASQSLFGPVRSTYDFSPPSPSRRPAGNPTLRLRHPDFIEYNDDSVDIEAPVPWYRTSLLARLAALEGKWLGTDAFVNSGHGDWDGRAEVVGQSELDGGTKAPHAPDQLHDREVVVEGLPVFPRKAALPAGAPKAGDIMFGIASTARRIDAISHIWPHWLGPQPFDGPNTTLPSCLVLLPREDFKPLDGRHLSTSPAYSLRRTLARPERGLGHCALRRTKLPHTERYEVRYFSLVREMKNLATEQGRNPMWWIVGDDDTAWVDMRTLRRELGSYDADQKWFIGGNTEAKNQYDTFGTMAYGGAGIIMSRGLFNAMDAMYEECTDRLKDTFGGDGIYTQCAAMAMGIEDAHAAVTPHPGLHQMDVPGDGTGFFQAGLPFVSLHHMWNGWTDAFAYEHPTPGFVSGDRDLNQLQLIMRVARFLGGDNLFKRFVFADGRELLCLGYSITLFEQPMVKQDLTTLEYTWSYDEYRLLWPHRPRIIESLTGTTVGPGQRAKDTYYLSEVILDEEEHPTRAVLRHVDRWGRFVDVVWEGGVGDEPRVVADPPVLRAGVQRAEKEGQAWEQ